MAHRNPAEHVHGRLAKQHYQAAVKLHRASGRAKGSGKAIALFNTIEQAALAADHAQYGDESILLPAVELSQRAQTQALGMMGTFGPIDPIEEVPPGRSRYPGGRVRRGRLNPKKKGKKKAKKKERLDGRDEEAVIKVVEKAQKGDRAAYARLFDAYQGRVYKGALRCVLAGRPRPTSGDLADANDITQAAFTKALEKLDKFEGKSKFFTWLYRITLNECMTWSRLMGKTASLKQARKLHKEAEQREIPAVLLESFSYTVEAERVADVIREALARLPKKQRDIIVMADMKGMSAQQIADSTKKVRRTVARDLLEARKDLQKLVHKRLAPAKEVTPEKIQKLTEEQGEDLVASLARQLAKMQADIGKLKAAGEKKKKNPSRGGRAAALRGMMRL